MMYQPKELTRETRETSIRLRLGGAGSSIRTRCGDEDEPFLAHMLSTFARYAALPLEVDATGDLRHHLVEDVAIALGAALRDAAPRARARYGHAVVPMDDALVEVTVDAGDRPFFAGRLPSPLYEHFLRSFALEAKWTLHVRVLRGRDRHHRIEAAFKALGLALSQALRPVDSVFSTKGEVRMVDSC